MPPRALGSLSPSPLRRLRAGPPRCHRGRSHNDSLYGRHSLRYGRTGRLVRLRTRPICGARSGRRDQRHSRSGIAALVVHVARLARVGDGRSSVVFSISRCCSASTVRPLDSFPATCDSSFQAAVHPDAWFCSLCSARWTARRPLSARHSSSAGRVERARCGSSQRLRSAAGSAPRGANRTPRSGTHGREQRGTCGPPIRQRALLRGPHDTALRRLGSRLARPGRSLDDRAWHSRVCGARRARSRRGAQPVCGSASRRDSRSPGADSQLRHPLYELNTSAESVRSPIVISEPLDDLAGCDPPVQSAPLVLR